MLSTYQTALARQVGKHILALNGDVKLVGENVLGRDQGGIRGRFLQRREMPLHVGFF